MVSDQGFSMMSIVTCLNKKCSLKCTGNDVMLKKKLRIIVSVLRGYPLTKSRTSKKRPPQKLRESGLNSVMVFSAGFIYGITKNRILSFQTEQGMVNQLAAFCQGLTSTFNCLASSLCTLLWNSPLHF